MRTVIGYCLWIAVAAIADVTPVHAQDNPIDPDKLEKLYEAVDDDREIMRHYRVCPAEIFETVRHVPTPNILDLDYSQVCADDPGLCLNQCINGRDASVCFDLALVLQENDAVVPPRYAQALFAQSCAGGLLVGCTNRGAGIRNGRYEGDPFEDTEAGEIDACLNATFDTMCGRGDAWGCYMIGQSYDYGEGRPLDNAEAKRYYEMACTAVNVSKSACAAAKRAIGYLD